MHDILHSLTETANHHFWNSPLCRIPFHFCDSSKFSMQHTQNVFDRCYNFKLQIVVNKWRKISPKICWSEIELFWKDNSKKIFVWNNNNRKRISLKRNNTNNNKHQLHKRNISFVFLLKNKQWFFHCVIIMKKSIFKGFFIFFINSMYK